MLEKPEIEEAVIAACLGDAYGLPVTAITFLPIGADRNTAVYRAATAESVDYFVKLRRGAFDEAAVWVPRLLWDQGVRQVIPPLPSQSQQLWVPLGEFKLTVSPFIDGHDGYDVRLTAAHWLALGQALHGLHHASLPPALAERLPHETYSSQWREQVRDFLRRVDETPFRDPVAAELSALLTDQRATILRLVQRAADLAAVLQAQAQPFVLCHADIHAGNVLIDSRDQLYVVDWDTLVLAPKERDLMYVGGGLFTRQRTPTEEEALFYPGYGPTEVDPVGIAYYRYERIVQDIAAYCQQILLTAGDGPDRAEGLRQLRGQFQPGEVIEIAFRSEQALPPAYRGIPRR